MINEKNTDNEIVIDPSSGISVEEQKEILSQINGIAEKNRKRLSESFQTEGLETR